MIARIPPDPDLILNRRIQGIGRDLFRGKQVETIPPSPHSIQPCPCSIITPNPTSTYSLKILHSHFISMA